MGKFRKSPLDGFHFIPNRKSGRPIFAIAGIPFANKKIQINATASTEVQAATRNMIFITFSLIDFIKSVPFIWEVFPVCKFRLLFCKIFPCSDVTCVDILYLIACKLSYTTVIVYNYCNTILCNYSCSKTSLSFAVFLSHVMPYRYRKVRQLQMSYQL